MLALVALLAPAGAQARPEAKTSQNGCANTNLKPTRANLELVRAAVLCLHNRERARHGLPRLRENPLLRRAAERHTDNMVSERFFDHTSPSGSTMVERIRRTGYTKRARSWALGENIAWGSGELRHRRADPPQLDEVLRPPRQHPPALVPRDRDRHRVRAARPALRRPVRRDLHHGLRVPPLSGPGGGGC